MATLAHPPTPRICALPTQPSLGQQVLKAASDPERGLTFAEYRAALEGVEADLRVEVPAED